MEMKKWANFLLILLKVFESATLSHSFQSRLEGGDAQKVDPPHKYPGVVSISTFGDIQHIEKWLFCAGTILSEQLVLTAAQCISSPFSKLISPSVVAGANNVMEDVNSDYPVQIRQAKSLHLHPEYDNSTPHVHDVGLILLDRAFEFNERVSKVHLSGVEVKLGSSLNITSWEYLETFKEYPYFPFFLLESSGKVLESSSNGSGTFVLGGGAGICAGDCGAPIFSGPNEQVGIVTIRNRSECPSEPKTVTLISSYIGWIEETRKSLEGPAANVGNDSNEKSAKYIFFLVVQLTMFGLHSW